jgi:hypothetical protein
MFGSSLKFGRDRRPDLVKEGTVFKHHGLRQQVEVAHVIKLTRDHRDIPHVQFTVHMEGADRPASGRSVRTLNLKDFLRYYGDPVNEDA